MTAYVVGGVILIALSIADHYQPLIKPDDDLSRYHGQSFRVTRVIDGDTLVVQTAEGTQERVRLWGVDCPELARPDIGRSEQPHAAQATAMTRALCEGRMVRLDLRPRDTRDRYQRLLAYVVLDSGVVLNEHLLATGMAKADDRFWHDRFERYATLHVQAKTARLGIWGGR